MTEFRTQILRQFSKDNMTGKNPMSNRHREEIIWYVIIVDRRTTCIGSVPIQGDRSMDSNTKIQYNNHSGMFPRVQEGVRLRDSNNLRVTKGAKVRVKGVRMMPRTRVLREKEVSIKAAQAQRQRRNGIMITPRTQVETKDMMNTRQRTKSKSKRQA